MEKRTIVCSYIAEKQKAKKARKDALEEAAVEAENLGAGDVAKEIRKLKDK